MKTLIPSALLLAACQTTSVPTAVGLEQQLRARALAFAGAMEARMTELAIPYAASSAKGFFEAGLEFEKMQWGEDEPRDPAEIAIKSSQVEGERGVAVLTMTREDQSQDLILHFELENDLWGAVGFGVGDSDEIRLFADREQRVRDRIARAIEETTPHPELGPIVKAYLAAGAQKDKTGMMAIMTPECRREEARENSFTSGFLAGRFKVKKWQFAGQEVEGDEAKQRVRTVLELPDGETDNEPMRFSFAKTTTGWVVTAIQ